jgi:Glyoxalase-like domain
MWQPPGLRRLRPGTMLARRNRRPTPGLPYWGVEDARAPVARLLELGASPRDDVQDVGEGILIGAVTDPFGNAFGIIQNPHFALPD